MVWSVVSFIDKVVIPIIPPKYNPLDFFDIYIPGLGVFLFLIVTTLIGSLASGFLGRQAIFLSEKVEEALTRHMKWHCASRSSWGNKNHY